MLVVFPEQAVVVLKYDDKYNLSLTLFRPEQKWTGCVGNLALANQQQALLSRIYLVWFYRYLLHCSMLFWLVLQPC